MSTVAFSYIDTPQALSTCFSRIEKTLEQEGMALDTEGNSLYSYRDRVCLIQISTRKEHFILDPLALEGLSGLQKLFQKGTVILHGGYYDIDSLKRDFSFQFFRIFDTMVAASILGYTEFSLAALVKAKLDVTLPKKHQKDNWGQRPLSPSMLEYAIKDTQYLHALQDLLIKELKERQLFEVAKEEFHVISQRTPRKIEFTPESCFKIRGAKQLSSLGRGVLYRIFCWRESVAKKRDVPPFRVLQNSTILLLAERRPKTKGALKRILGISPLFVNRYGEKIIKLIRNATPKPSKLSVQKTTLSIRISSDEDKELLRRLRIWRDQKAEQLKMPPSIIAPSAFLESLVQKRPSSQRELSEISEARKWRITRFGKELLQYVHSFEKGE